MENNIVIFSYGTQSTAVHECTPAPTYLWRGVTTQLITNDGCRHELLYEEPVDRSFPRLHQYVRPARMRPPDDLKFFKKKESHGLQMYERQW